MIPIGTPKSNHLFTSKHPQWPDLPAQILGPKLTNSYWFLTDEELATLKETRIVMLSVGANGSCHPPVAMTAPPARMLEVITGMQHVESDQPYNKDSIPPGNRCFGCAYLDSRDKIPFCQVLTDTVPFHIKICGINIADPAATSTPPSAEVPES